MRFLQLLKRLLSWLVWLPGLLIVLFVWTGFPFWSSNDGSYFESSSISDETMIDTFHSDFIFNDSLPHYRYKAIEDSLEWIRDAKKFNNTFSIEGFAASYVGFYTATRRDSFFIDPSKRGIKSTPLKKTVRYYLGLGNYFLAKDHETLRDSGRSYLKYPVWTHFDSVRKHRSGHYEIKKIDIDVADLPEEKRYNQNEPRTLYIQVSKTKYDTLKIILGSLTILFKVFFVIVCFLLPLWVLKDIASKNCFEERTYKRLFLIAFTILGSILFDILLAYITHGIYKEKIPAAFSLSMRLMISNSIVWLVAGYITLIFAFAFRRGYRLQHDQSLTI